MCNKTGKKVTGEYGFGRFMGVKLNIRADYMYAEKRLHTYKKETGKVVELGREASGIRCI